MQLGYHKSKQRPLQKAKSGQMSLNSEALRGGKKKKEKQKENSSCFLGEVLAGNKRLGIKSKEIPSFCLMIVLTEIQFSAHFQ